MVVILLSDEVKPNCKNCIYNVGWFCELKKSKLHPLHNHCNEFVDYDEWLFWNEKTVPSVADGGDSLE